MSLDDQAKELLKTILSILGGPFALHWMKEMKLLSAIKTSMKKAAAEAAMRTVSTQCRAGQVSTDAPEPHQH